MHIYRPPSWVPYLRRPGLIFSLLAGGIVSGAGASTLTFTVSGVGASTMLMGMLAERPRLRADEGDSFRGSGELEDTFRHRVDEGSSFPGTPMPNPDEVADPLGVT